MMIIIIIIITYKVDFLFQTHQWQGLFDLRSSGSMVVLKGNLVPRIFSLFTYIFEKNSFDL